MTLEATTRHNDEGQCEAIGRRPGDIVLQQDHSQATGNVVKIAMGPTNNVQSGGGVKEPNQHAIVGASQPSPIV